MEDDPTISLPLDRSSSPSRSGSASLDGGRFAPGTLIDARYRVVGLLGRGGMGEVYRAEDLRLAETVALKFLPRRLVRDGAALARFHREVRTARQVTHRNVVRVHDIGEVDGEPFLSMEFVPGEDLASLLKRIGRLPQEKGVALAGQICAGLAAAHEKGVLHRDLKPANVMIDAEGNARINDFGLAELAGDLQEGGLAGTPLYMAPEQLDGGPATVASDVYALGLVLWEIFTGERPESGSTLDDLRRIRSEEPRAASGALAELDPAIGRTLRRCLAPEPERRPRRALEVAAALPGGDPLAAALAAGETPSPEMVAHAAVEDSLPRRWSNALLILGLGLLGLVVGLRGSRTVYHLDGVPLKPEVLEHRAGELLRAAGHELAGRGEGELEPTRSLPRLRSLDPTPEQVEHPETIRPGLVEYVYRAADGPLGPRLRWNMGVTRDDPPIGWPGTARVILDSRGRLLELAVAVADPRIAKDGPSPPEPASPGLEAWFEASGLVADHFSPREPDRLPPVPAFEGSSFAGTWPDGTGDVRVDAWTLGERLVWWSVRDEVAPEDGKEPPWPLHLALTVLTVMWVLGSLLASRHLRQGRADLRGAAVLAGLTGGTSLAESIVWGGRSLLDLGFSLAFSAMAEALLVGASMGVVYLAVEPLFRRHLPRVLVSWNRLLRGGWRDPLVARDVTVGLVAVLALMGVAGLVAAAEGRWHVDFPHGPRPLWGLAWTLSGILSWPVFVVPLGLLFLLIVPRTAVAHRPVAEILGGATLGVFVLAWNGLGVFGILSSVLFFLLARFVGFLGLVGMAFGMANVRLVPIAWDPAIWWAPRSWIGIAVVAGLLLVAHRNLVRAASLRASGPVREA